MANENINTFSENYRSISVNNKQVQASLLDARQKHEENLPTAQEKSEYASTPWLPIQGKADSPLELVLNDELQTKQAEKATAFTTLAQKINANTASTNELNLDRIHLEGYPNPQQILKLANNDPNYSEEEIKTGCQALAKAFQAAHLTSADTDYFSALVDTYTLELIKQFEARAENRFTPEALNLIVDNPNALSSRLKNQIAELNTSTETFIGALEKGFDQLDGRTGFSKTKERIKEVTQRHMAHRHAAGQFEIDYATQKKQALQNVDNLIKRFQKTLSKSEANALNTLKTEIAQTENRVTAFEKMISTNPTVKNLTKGIREKVQQQLDSLRNKSSQQSALLPEMLPNSYPVGREDDPHLNKVAQTISKINKLIQQLERLESSLVHIGGGDTYEDLTSIQNELNTTTRKLKKEVQKLYDEHTQYQRHLVRITHPQEAELRAAMEALASQLGIKIKSSYMSAEYNSDRADALSGKISSKTNDPTIENCTYWHNETPYARDPTYVKKEMKLEKDDGTLLTRSELEALVRAFNEKHKDNPKMQKAKIAFSGDRFIIDCGNKDTKDAFVSQSQTEINNAIGVKTDNPKASGLDTTPSGSENGAALSATTSTNKSHAVHEATETTEASAEERSAEEDTGSGVSGPDDDLSPSPSPSPTRGG